MLFEVAQALVERLGEEVGFAVEREEVEDEELGLLVAVGERVEDELAVDEGARVEGRAVVREREVQVALAEPPVVVLAVDEVVAFVAGLVAGQIEEVADAVGLFADVVAGGG